MGTAFAIAGNILLDDAVAHAQETEALDGHFYPKGKAPSVRTKAILEDALTNLPFSDTTDFEEQERGLIAEMPQKQIMADTGHVA